MKSSLRDRRNDREKSTKGIPLKLGGELVVWVRRAGGFNLAWRHAMSEAVSEWRDELDQLEEKYGDEERPEVEAIQTKILCRAVSRSLIDRWAGVTDEKGRELAFDEAEAFEWLIDAPDDLQRIIAAADRGEDYRLEADTKSP